jgi:cobaltochelatase CobS
MTQQEINSKIEAMERIIGNPSTPENIRSNAQSKLDELKAMTPITEEVVVKETKKEKKSKTTTDGSSTIDAMLTTLRAMMLSNQGGGVDSYEVRKMIEEFLTTRKINLDELDKSVLDEIRKNQIVVLSLPKYDLQITVDKSTAMIPNIFSILDDVLAGNNVYLIGEAGSGKTISAEKVSEILNREYLMLNCSQYTSPTEILGGQTIEGYKDGKLVIAWRDGKILVLDEMPKLDPNTAGLLNDALAKSSKTRKNPKINSTNPSEPPIPRNENFAVIATGNVYPNKPNPAGYVGNNQQDLSLLDRFSGSVYYVDYSQYIDEESCRYKFLYDMLVGNYHEYIKAKRDGRPLPTPRGLRTIIEANNMKNMALVSYRTIIAFRVGFEIELVRAIAKKQGDSDVTNKGKTVLSTFESYLVAFGDDAKQTLIRESGYTYDEVEKITKNAIDLIVNGGESGFVDSLTPMVKETASKIYSESTNWLIADKYIVN